MLEDFAQLVYEVFPGIDPYTLERAKSSIRKFISGGNEFEIAHQKLIGGLDQGDILGPLRFTYTDQDGNLNELEAFGMMISNSCDSEREEYLTFCPCIESEEFFRNHGNIRADTEKNHIFQLFFVTGYKNLVVDFKMMTSINRNLINQLMQNQQIKLEGGLTQMGWYFFVAKLTAHLMRPDDPDTLKARPKYKL